VTAATSPGASAAVMSRVKASSAAVWRSRIRASRSWLRSPGGERADREAGGEHDLNSSFCQHLGHVLVRQRITQIPTYGQQDHLTRVLTSFKWIGRRDWHRLPYHPRLLNFATQPFFPMGSLKEQWRP